MKGDILREVLTAKGLKVNELRMAYIHPREVLGMPKPMGATIQYKKTRYQYRPEDCAACLRDLPHTQAAHETALRRNDEASYPDEPSYNP